MAEIATLRRFVCKQGTKQPSAVVMATTYNGMYGRERREATRLALHKLSYIIPTLRKYERDEAFIRGAAEVYIRERLAEKEQLEQRAIRNGMSEAEFEQLWRDIGNWYQRHDSGVVSHSQVYTGGPHENEETPAQDVQSHENGRCSRANNGYRSRGATDVHDGLLND